MEVQLAMYINMSVGYRDGIGSLIWMSYFTEISLYLLSFVLSPFALHISSATPIFHPNLLLILQQSFYHFYFCGIARFLMIFYESQSTLRCQIYRASTDRCQIALMIASFIRSYVVIALNSCFVGVMIERLIATMYFATYEHRHHRPLFVSLIIFGILLSFSMNANFFFGSFAANYGNYFQIFVTISTGIVTFVVSLVNDRRRRTLHFSGYTLSKRFQLTANVKAIKIMIIYILQTSLNDLCLAALCLLHFSSLSPFDRNIYGILINLQLALQPFIYNCIALFGNHQSREMSIRIFQKIIHSIRLHPQKEISSKRQSVIDVHGKVMYTGANQDDYFDQLKAQW